MFEARLSLSIARLRFSVFFAWELSQATNDVHCPIGSKCDENALCCDTISDKKATGEEQKQIVFIRYLLDQSPQEPLHAVGEWLVLAISDFDGVHQEHQRMIAHTRQLARQLGATPVALTFWPQPGIAGDFNGPQVSAGQLLTTLEERLELLAELAEGANNGDEGGDPPLAGVYVASYGASYGAAMEDTLRSPTAMMAQCERWFGAGRIVAMQCEIANVSGARSDAGANRPAEPPIALDGTKGSAAAEHAEICALIGTGRLAEATRRLGYAYRLHGEVGPGDQRGRLLGFPTANLRCDPRKVLPDNGVYAVRVRLPGESAFTHAGAANVGVRPTFTVEGMEPRRLVEIYLLDATIDLYGLTIGVEFVARLRGEVRFSGEHALDDLVAQMARDIEQTRQVLGSLE